MDQIKSSQNANAPDSESSKMKTEIWQKKRERINEKRRERRQRQKEENLKSHADEKKEQRQKQKEEDPEYTARESAKRQERRQRARENEKLNLLFNHQKMLNDHYDSYFEKNKHTFPTPVSQNHWEKLKKDELDFEKHFFGTETTIKELNKYHQDQIELLQKNPDHPCAGSIIFYIKTFVHRPKDQRKLTDEEKDWVKSLILTPKEEETKKYNYYETKKEYYKEKAKASYESAKRCQKTHNLNLHFMKADPNKVLSLDDITRNPFVSNFSIREEYKINLWKSDKNSEYLEKWKREREIYEKEVEELSIEYKENFLKQMK